MQKVKLHSGRNRRHEQIPSWTYFGDFGSYSSTGETFIRRSIPFIYKVVSIFSSNSIYSTSMFPKMIPFNNLAATSKPNSFRNSKIHPRKLPAVIFCCKCTRSLNVSMREVCQAERAFLSWSNTQWRERRQMPFRFWQGGVNSFYFSFSFNECLYFSFFYVLLYVFEEEKISPTMNVCKECDKKLHFWHYLRVYHWSEREVWVLFTDYLPRFTYG